MCNLQCKIRDRNFTTAMTICGKYANNVLYIGVFHISNKNSDTHANHHKHKLWFQATYKTI